MDRDLRLWRRRKKTSLQSRVIKDDPHPCLWSLFRYGKVICLVVIFFLFPLFFCQFCVASCGSGLKWCSVGYLFSVLQTYCINIRGGKLKIWEERRVVFNCRSIYDKNILSSLTTKTTQRSEKSAEVKKYLIPFCFLSSFLIFLWLLKGGTCQNINPDAPTAVCAHYLAPIKHKTPSLRLHSSTH